MPNNNYRRGNGWEVRAAEDLTAIGYWVIQTRGSKTAADLVALKSGRPVILAQIKSPGVRLDSHGWNDLFELAQLCGATPLVCEWIGRPPVVAYHPAWFQIVDWHEPHARLWPREAWNETTPKGMSEGVK